jgi:hypothetical protein
MIPRIGLHQKKTYVYLQENRLVDVNDLSNRTYSNRTSVDIIIAFKCDDLHLHGR